MRNSRNLGTFEWWMPLHEMAIWLRLFMRLTAILFFVLLVNIVHIKNLNRDVRGLNHQLEEIKKWKVVPESGKEKRPTLLTWA